jgi:hypothetical protein
MTKIFKMFIEIKKSFFYCFIGLLLLLLVNSGHVQAQPTPPDTPQSPIDGGLSLLLGAGAVAAAVRYQTQNRK